MLMRRCSHWSGANCQCATCSGETSSAAHISYTVRSVSTRIPKAHLHANSCRFWYKASVFWRGRKVIRFHVFSRQPSHMGAKSKRVVFCFFCFFYGWIRSSRQRERWGEEKDSWSVRVYGAVEESNIIHACHAIRLGTVQVQRGRCCVREKNCELTSWREQV